MRDIFISYAREDQAKVELLARALVAHGWTVFWDRTIPAGKTWRDVIGQQLDTARCVVVVWSKSSVVSEWVIEEADAGKERGVLVPVLIDQIRAPLGFRSVQAADLSVWDGTPAASSFEQLLSDISGILASQGSAERSGNLVAPEAHAGASPEERSPPGNRHSVPTAGASGVERAVQEPSSQFAPVSHRVPLLIFLAAALGAYASPRVGGFQIHFWLLQIITVAYLGYRYGVRIGLISGVIVFLPNHLGHLYGYAASTFGGPEQKVAWQGTLFLGWFKSSFGAFRTYGVAYFYLALVGAASAVLKEQLSALPRRRGFVPLSDAVLVLLVICGYVLAQNVRVGPLILGARDLGFLLPMLLVYRYGPAQAGSVLRWLLPALCISLVSGSLSFGYQFSGTGVVLFCLSMVALACATHDSPNEAYVKARGWFWALTVLLVVLGSWRFQPAKSMVFYSAWAALPVVMLIGSRCGPRSGFMAGLAWGWANIINLYLGNFGYGAPTSFLMVAPVLGYLGGMNLLRRDFLVTGAILLAAFYVVEVLGRFVFVGFTIEWNFDEMISPTVGFIALMILSPMARSSDVLHRAVPSRDSR